MSTTRNAHGKTRRIGLLVPGLQYGGAERVAVQLAAHWSEQGHDVALITLSPTRTDSYALPQGITRIGLDLQQRSSGLLAALVANRRRTAAIARVLAQHDCEIVVSLTDTMNVLAVMAARQIGLPVIVAERTEPRYHRLSRIWKWLRRGAYHRADAVIVQTASVRGWVEATCRPRRVFVIPNGVAKPRVGLAGVRAARRESRRVVGVGRLSPEKGFQHLIEAFADCRHCDGWRLEILGEGPQRPQLERLIEARHVNDAVFLRGWVDDVPAFLMQSDLFVLPSDYEGFPNSLLEAMNCGLPVIAFDCPSGPREIIRDGVDGLLVPNGDVAALTAAMDRLMTDEQQRHALGRAALEVRTRFALKDVLRQWDDAVAEVIADRQQQGRPG